MSGLSPLNIYTFYVNKYYANNEWLWVTQCVSTDIFIEWKMECSIQRGEGNLNTIIHLSPNENICSIIPMQYIHYFSYTTSKINFRHLQCLINLYILENVNSVLVAPYQVKRHRSAIKLHYECFFHNNVIVQFQIRSLQFSSTFEFVENVGG